MASVANMVVRIGGDISDAVKKINALQTRLTVFQNQITRLNKLSLTPGLNEAQTNRINALLEKTKQNLQGVSSQLGGVKGAADKAASGFGGLGNVVGSLAGRLLGLGIAGLAVAIGKTLVDALTKSKAAFSDLEIFTLRFKQSIDDTNDSLDTLKSTLDFKVDIFKLKAGLFGRDETTDLLGLEYERDKGLEYLGKVDKELNKLEGSFNKLKPIVESVTKSLTTPEVKPGLTPGSVRFKGLSPLGEAIKEFGSIDKIPTEAFKKFTDEQQKYLNNYKEATDQIKKLKEDRLNTTRRLEKLELLIEETSNKIKEKGSVETAEAIKKGADKARKAREDALEANRDYLNKLKKQNEEEKKLRSDKLKDIIADLKEQTLAELEGGSPFIQPKQFINVDLSDFDRIGDKITELRANLFNLSKIDALKGVDLSGQIEGLQERLALLVKMSAVIRDNSRDKDIAENFKKIQDAAIKTADTISNTIGSAIGSMVDAFKSGTNPIEAFFIAVGQAIQQLVIQLITAAVKAFILKQILSIAFPGLASINSIFGSGFSIGGLADGGPVTGRTPYIVGERGPELFVPSTSGQIIPNNRLGGIAGAAGQMVSVLVTGRISGRDILLSGAREGRYQGRNV